MPDNFLTTAQAAELLEITNNGVRQAILHGRLPAEKHGRDWLIKKADASTYKVSNRKPGRK